MVRSFVGWATLFGCGALLAAQPDSWTVIRNKHFEVYSQADGSAQKAIAWFERLRTFFASSDLLGAASTDEGKPPMRLILFRSEKEYEAYRFHPLAVAHYANDGSRDYIVTLASQVGGSAISAHEYAHYAIHSAGLKLPPCWSEGMAEVFSTLRVVDGHFQLGGPIPAREKLLGGKADFSLESLFLASPLKGKDETELFYSQSWLLADMLMTSPDYRPLFPRFIAQINSGAKEAPAFSGVYGKTLYDVARDLARWLAKPRAPQIIPVQLVEPPPAETVAVSGREAKLLLARLLLASGNTDKARTSFVDLMEPDGPDPEVRSALGAIALRQGNRQEALTQWRRAIAENVVDPELCYRYAVLADDAGVPAKEVQSALERAVLLSPHFDDARFMLALYLNRAGEHRSAVENLRAMKTPIGDRRYGYWIALASALSELNDRDGAKSAARQALLVAKTEDDTAIAKQIIFVANTDLTVRFATDSDGKSQMVTTRVPHGTSDWNPFVEPTDKMLRASGNLDYVLCVNDKLTGFRVKTPKGPVKVEVPDPYHVLMSNAPPQFYCGPIREMAVEADYAVVGTRNILRGMTFQR